MMMDTRLLRGQRGMGTVGMILTSVLVGVAGFALLMVGGAYLDVGGFQKDLEENLSQMQYTCLNSDCEEEFFDELETLRVLKARDLELDWDNLDWLGADNKLVVKGWKVVNFRVWKYYYYFTFEVPIHK